MKVALFTPYLDTLGGGERFMMTIAEVLSKINKIDLLLDSHLYLMDSDKLLKNLSQRFGLDLEKINLVKAPIGKDSNALERLFFLMKYDVFIYLTDGSIFYPTATRNILHIQSPIKGQPAKSLWGKLKLSGWEQIVYNSHFTQSNCQNFWPIRSRVIYPPVDVDRIKPLEKKKYILSVGRFFGFLKDKKQEILIDTFRKISKDKQLKGWSLNLVGSATDGDKVYIEELKKKAKGLPINFFPNLGYDELIKLYGYSSIYWHAAGFEEDDPTKMEHFGISTVEAMSAGCVPIVIDKGGQTEIVNDGKNGFLWNSLEDLENLTLKVIEDERIREEFSKLAIIKAQEFSKDNFEKNILDLI